MDCCNPKGGLRGDVTILQKGNCSNCDCGNARFDTGPMDSRLAPFITGQQYDECVTECNERVFKQFGPNYCLTVTLVFVVPLLLGQISMGQYVPSYQKCDTEACPNITSIGTKDCCTWHCCGGAGIGTWVDYGQNDTTLCVRIEEQKSEQCGCRQRKVGKNKEFVDCGELFLKGPFTPQEASGTIFLIIGILCFSSFICTVPFTMCYARGKFKSGVENAFVPLSQAGCKLYFFAGAKHQQAALYIDVPGSHVSLNTAGVTAMPGAMPMASGVTAVAPAAVQQMQITIPPGVVPGQVLIVEAPSGKMQVTVPQGMEPGMTLNVALPTTVVAPMAVAKVFV